MTTATDSEPWAKLEEWAERGDAGRLLEEAEALGPRECARAISRLSIEDQNKILMVLGPARAAELLGELPDTQAQELLRHLPAEYIAPILSEFASDESADFLAQLDDDTVQEVLGEMAPEAAARTRKLAAYRPNVAGGLMIAEYLAFPAKATAQKVIDDLRANSDEYAEYSIQYTYVIDEDGVLEGVLPLRDLLLTPANTPITKIMIRNPRCVYDTATLDELSEFFDENDFLGVPVTDEGHRLVGVLRRRDLREALGDRAQNDYLKTQGIVGGEELRSMPVLVRSGRRLSWLSVNILLNFISASVIGLFTETLEAVIALAIFLPIISDMSGCSGNQAVAVSMRELTMGLLRPADVAYVWFKEVTVGLMNGLVLGVLIAGIAWLAPFGFWNGSPYLGLVVGVAMALNTIVAVMLGGTIPLVLKYLKADPALASGPILTTVTDMCGFFLVLSFATMVLPYLTAV